jgi:[protein-PII] uridylyltransferase
VEAHLAQLPLSYRLRTPPAVIAEHIALIDRAHGGTAIEHTVIEGVDHLTVATSDRPGILALLAGTLAARGVNILSGNAHTRDDGAAIDVLRVQGPRSADAAWWDGVCEMVSRALDGSLAPVPPATTSAARPAPAVPTTVYIDDDRASEFTKIEVNAVDRVGLLYVLSETLHAAGLDIHFATVDTAGPLATDTFYVRKADGTALGDASAVDALRSVIVAAVDAL